MRCAMVIDSVLAITKLPTKSAIPANASRNFWMKDVKPLIPFLSSFTWALVSRTCAVGGRSGRISPISFDVGTPCLACTRITSSFPTLCSSLWIVGRSKTAIVAPPIETPGKATMPAMRKRCTGPRASTPTLSPMCKFSADAEWLSIAISSAPVGHVPPFRTSGLNFWFERAS